MIRKSHIFVIMGLAWFGAVAAAPEDPCAGLDLSSIAGLRSAMIGRVHPATFSEGDLVTVCGRGLSTVKLIDNYQPQAKGQLEAGNFIEIGDEINKRGWKFQVFGLTTSRAGDRITFVVGGPFEGAYQPLNSDSPAPSKSYCLVPAGRPGLRAVPTSVQGELKLVLSASGFSPPKVIGPTVTWNTGGPKLRRVYGRFFNKQEPFVITPQGGGQLISPELGSITIEGGNLRGATYRIGDAKLTQYHLPGEDGTSVLAYVPSNASSGSVCAAGNGENLCGGSLTVQRGPTITRTPQMPLSVHTSYVIEGTELQPNVPGLTYRLVMSGLTGDESCGQVLKISEHTAKRIVFSLGDVSDKTTLPEACLRAGNYQTPQENPSNLMFLMARYKNNDQPLFRIHYYLNR
jgi:hypothetical protein